MKEVNIYTKTSFRGMKRQKGFGIYVISTIVGDKEVSKTVKVDFEEITPNAAELKIVIEALKRFNQKCELHIFTDSSYVANYSGMLPEWKKRRFKTAKGEPIANTELWKELDHLIKGHEIHWEVLKEHPYRKWLDSEIKRESIKKEEELKNKPPDAAV